MLLKYICASFLILLSGMMSAQDVECVTVEFSYTIELSESLTLKGDASVVYQDKSYYTYGEGFESYCDGSTLWMLDLEAKEVYIEAVSPEDEALMSDVMLKLAGMESGSEGDFASPDGQTVHVRLKSMKKSAGKDISCFRPTQSFDSSWVVIDIR